MKTAVPLVCFVSTTPKADASIHWGLRPRRKFGLVPNVLDVEFIKTTPQVKTLV